VYLQLDAELGRNVDLHGAAKVVERLLVPVRSAHWTWRECLLVRRVLDGFAPVGGPIAGGARWLEAVRAEKGGRDLYRNPLAPRDS
jgi:hypothetical protein